MGWLTGKGWFWVAVIVLAAVLAVEDDSDDEPRRDRHPREQRAEERRQRDRPKPRPEPAEPQRERRAEQRDRSRPERPADLPRDAVRTRVTGVADGDTVDLAGLGSSRLIGVDTPEVFFGKECYGARASAFTKDRLAPGTVVYYLRGTDRRDDFGRDLVYVWLEGGALLAKEGYATPLAIAPNVDFAALFRRLAASARHGKRGLWARCR
jgi:micrococcal nuclease